jgi:hypothetical protein
LARVKGQLYDSDHLKLAVQGAAGRMFDSVAVGAGAVATLCIDSGCRLLLNGNAVHLWIREDGSTYGEDSPDMSILATGAVLLGITRNVMLMTEVVAVRNVDEGRWEREFAAFFGVRLAGQRGTIDAGVMQFIADSVPWLNVTVRL